MRTRTLLFLAIAALAPAAPAEAHAPPPARAQSADTVIQAGTYDLAVAFGGGVLDATLELAYAGDTVTAVLRLGDHQSPVRAGARRGNRLALEPISTAVDVRYDLEFNGAAVTGTFTYQKESGTVTGRRRAPRR